MLSAYEKKYSRIWLCLSKLIMIIKTLWKKNFNWILIKIGRNLIQTSSDCIRVAGTWYTVHFGLWFGCWWSFSKRTNKKVTSPLSCMPRFIYSLAQHSTVQWAHLSKLWVIFEMTKRMYNMSVPAENKENDDDDELTSNFRLRRAFHSHSFAFFFSILFKRNTSTKSHIHCYGTKECVTQMPTSVNEKRYRI